MKRVHVSVSSSSSSYDSESEEEEEEVLSVSQQKVLDDIGKGDNMFITGSAGSGKSFLLRKITELLAKKNKNYVLTASTGIAALHIHGCTLHSFAGIGLGDGKFETELEKLKKWRAKVDEWKALQVLIIDEISMIQVKYLQKLDTIAKDLRCSSRPFGGIQLIMIGDYFQCPSVEKKKDIKYRFPFQSPLWKELNVKSMALKENFRQAGDLEFFKLLERIRIGETTTCDLKTLESRNIENHKDIDVNNLIKLCPLRKSVEYINKIELEKISGPSFFYKAEYVKYNAYGQPQKESASKKASILPEKEDRYPVDMEIELKVGVEVILCCNMDKDNGLVNGLRGKIVEFRRESNNSEMFPVVVFANGFRSIIKQHRWETKKKKCITSSFTQIPLIPRYAVTIHRVQGLTIKDDILVDMRFFECGQCYVSLSRACALNQIYLENIDVKKFFVSKEVLEFYRTNNLL